MPFFAQLTIGQSKVVKGPGLSAGPNEVLPKDVKLFIPVHTYKKWVLNPVFGYAFGEFCKEHGLKCAEEAKAVNPGKPGESSGGDPPAKRTKMNPEHILDLKTVTDALLVEVKLATSPLKIQSRVGKTMLVNNTTNEAMLPKWPGIQQNNLLIGKGHTTCKMVSQLCRAPPPPVVSKHILPN